MEHTKESLLQELARSVRDKRVLDAIERVPRDLFVPADKRKLAYANVALPIGRRQTISQPLMVALMTEAAQVQPTDRVLEVGTGSGYQAAVLAQLASEVVTVERIAELRDQARKLLRRLGYENVRVYPALDTLGYPPLAPYDAILVTAAAPNVPDGLWRQLKEGGRLVIPVGFETEQELAQVTKVNGEKAVRWLGPCRFVPLIGPDAWPESY
jgi:protein-L-isoaspartate(D-aspartate) O-methyltransferase